MSVRFTQKENLPIRIKQKHYNSNNHLKFCAADVTVAKQKWPLSCFISMHFYPKALKALTPLY